ncbi:MAG: hypothetical protein HY691_01280 [Chloroflexi bacterium]|nr:hypothetical protein [Chloroflexota bacterium]
MDGLTLWGAAVAACALATGLLVVLRAALRRAPRAGGLARGLFGRRRRTCPHLGLAGDPFRHVERPSDEHRCYAYLQRDRVDLAHQRAFCLSASYHRCPWLAIRPGRARRWMPAHLRATALRRYHAAAVALGTIALRLRRASAARRHAAVALVGLVGALGLAHLRSAGAALRRAAMASGRGAVHEAARAAAAARDALRVALRLLVTTLRLLALRALRAAGRLGAMAWATVRAGPRRDRRALRLAPTSAGGALPHSTPVARGTPSPRRSVTRSIGAPPLPSDTEPASPVALSPRAETGPGREATQPLATPVYTARQAARELDLMERGLAAVEAGREAEAHDLFREAVAANPRSVRAWFWLAKTAPTLDELIVCLEHALALEPANEQVRRNLVWALRRREQAREMAAVPADALAAIALRPTLDGRPAAGAELWSGLLGLVRAAGAAAAIMLGAAWFAGGLPPELRQAWPVGDYGLAALVPTVDLARGPAVAWLDLWPGYSVLSAAPFVLGFLSLFVAAGVLGREDWTRLWGPLLALASVGLWPGALAAAPGHPALALGGLLALGSLASAAADD